ncbi:MAG: DUF4097 family beta strand repeat-containing protein [Nocardioides sp.]
MSSYEFETHEPVDLYVEIGKGNVIITASDTTATTVDVDGRDSDKVDVRQDGRQISVVGPKSNRGLFGGEPQYVVTISLPTRSNAVVKTGSADVQMDGTFGHGQVKSGSGDCRLDTFESPVIIETGSGDINLTRAGAELRVKSGSGDVNVEHVQGTSSVSTGSGDVELGTTSAPTVVKTGSGDLEIGHAGDGVSMSTGSGDMRIRHASKGKLNAKGASGDVVVGIPAGVPVWTDLTTVSGDISSDLQGSGQPEPGADYIELRAKTVSGDIHLSEV